VLVEQGRARVFTRNGFDWSDCYPGIVRAALTSNASQQSSMVRPRFRMATVLGFRDGHALFKACSDWSQPDLAQDAILIDDVLAEPRRG
jgi:hypothetical protein